LYVLPTPRSNWKPTELISSVNTLMKILLLLNWSQNMFPIFCNCIHLCHFLCDKNLLLWFWGFFVIFILNCLFTRKQYIKICSSKNKGFLFVCIKVKLANIKVAFASIVGNKTISIFTSFCQNAKCVFTTLSDFRRKSLVPNKKSKK